MAEYKLIAFDMDGTLLNSKKEISEGNLSAIRKAQECGKFVTLSTGRNMVELKKVLEDTPDLRYVICVNGALVYNVAKKEYIHTTTLSFDMVSTIFKRIRPYDCMVHIHSDKSIVQRDKESHIWDYNMGQYREMFDALSTMPECIEEYYLENKPPVYKFNMYCKSKEQRQELKELLSDLPITMAFAEEASLECSSLGTSKASGLQALCDYLNITTEESIAVGDAENDLAILEAAGLAVAMANSKTPVFKYADVVVAGNDEDGCAEAIYKYLIPEESIH